MPLIYSNAVLLCLIFLEVMSSLVFSQINSCDQPKPNHKEVRIRSTSLLCIRLSIQNSCKGSLHLYTASPGSTGTMFQRGSAEMKSSVTSTQNVSSSLVMGDTRYLFSCLSCKGCYRLELWDCGATA